MTTAGTDRPLTGASSWSANVLVQPMGELATEPGADGVLRVHLSRSSLTLKGLDDGVRAALVLLAGGGSTMERLVEVARNARPEADLDRLLREISRLWARGALEVVAVDGPRPLLRVEPTSRLAVLRLGFATEIGMLRLSRFALVRRSGATLVLDGLVTHTCSRLVEPALASVLGGLADGSADAPRLADSLGCDVRALLACLALLHAAGVADVPGADGRWSEDRRPDLLVREPQDLLLHNRSRAGLTGDLIGGTAPFAGRLAPMPARRPLWPGPRIHLPPPSAAGSTYDGMSLVEAMQRRRSERRFGSRLLTQDELGELLHRVFRVRATLPPDAQDERTYEAQLRPIPSAGGMQDLEVYLAAAHVDGLERALYHYDPEEHLLTEVSRSTGYMAALLGNAAQTAGLSQEPPNVLLLASRFGRLGWKYEGISYALTLKNVGVVYEAVYLAATAIGLATCALGSGDSASFAVMTGLPSHVESTVGEMLLGPPPDEATEAGG